MLATSHGCDVRPHASRPVGPVGSSSEVDSDELSCRTQADGDRDDPHAQAGGGWR
ncbi:hypothetical protein [Parasphingorhabdus pacifica]